MYNKVLFTGHNVDFNSEIRTVRIASGTNSSTFNITVINDNIIEGDEMFTMNLSIPATLNPGVTNDRITVATATIIDTSSRLYYTRWLVLYLII